MGAHFCRHFRNSSRLCRRPKGNGAPHAGRAIHHPVLAPTLPSAYRVDLLVGRKPAGLLLRKGEPAIDGNLKHPADPGHQLDIGAVFLLQPIPRTEGTRFIVSRFAPLDSDFHRFVLSSATMVQFYHAASAASRRGTRDGIVSVSKKLAQPAALPAIILAAALMLTVGPSAALRIVDSAGDPATAYRLGTVSSEIQMTAFLRRRSVSRCRVAFGGVRCEFLPQITRGGVNAR